MNHKIEILSESLDKINIGTIPEAEDQELSDLLEVAALLRKSGLNAPPPEHILSAAVDRSVAGLAAQKHSHRRSWMYSGFLGAAAALLIFFGLHGLPSPQEIASVVTPPPQTVTIPPAEKTSSEAIIPSTDTSVPEQSTPSPKPDSAVPAESSPSASPQPSRPKAPATPSATPPQSSAVAPSRQETLASPSMKSAPAPRSVEQAALPAAHSLLRLPGRTPESVTHDSTAGTVRQVYDQGTAKELIITRRITPSVENNKASRKASPRIAAEADSAKSLTFQDSNKVVIFIKGQEVTLEGRQTLQELTELGEKLKAANP